MARFNEILASRLTRGLNALLRVQEMEGLRTLSPELVPTVTVLGDRPENAYVMGEHYFVGNTNVGAVVGQRSGIAIINPAGSGFITVILNVHASIGVAGGDFLAAVQPESAVPAGFAAAVQAGQFFDARKFLSVPNSATRIRTGAAAGAWSGGSDWMRNGVTSETIDFRGMPAVLSPGSAYLAQLNTDNTAVRFGWLAFERAVAPEELSV